jgi:carbohydrate diacid regulator
VNLGGKVHSYKDYVLIKILEDVPKAKLNEYLQVLLDSPSKEIFESKEMMSTAEEFLENSLNVSETSRKLFLHRNTLTYRLDKIQSVTGLDIRNFSDALTFRLISILAKQVN